MSTATEKQTRSIHASKLQQGMVVKTPKWVRDMDGRRVPMSELWPEAPETLVVEHWDWEEGETYLRSSDGKGGIDSNSTDYPRKFTLVVPQKTVKLSPRTTVKVHNVAYRDDAEPLMKALHGQSYMNLEVTVAPAGGSFDVWASTSRPNTSKEELREMVMSLLVTCVLDMGSAPVMRALGEGCQSLASKGHELGRRAVAMTDARVREHYGKARTGARYETV